MGLVYLATLTMGKKNTLHGDPMGWEESEMTEAGTNHGILWRISFRAPRQMKTPCV